MRAGESRTVIKRMQEFMDNLDRHVLNQKVLGNVKVKHLAAAFLAYKALQGMGKMPKPPGRFMPAGCRQLPRWAALAKSISTVRRTVIARR